MSKCVCSYIYFLSCAAIQVLGNVSDEWPTLCDQNHALLPP